MSGGQVLLSTWDWNPTVLAGCAALIAAYVLAVPHPGRRIVWYLAGVWVLAFALVSPVDTLGDRYLFSAHMLQHLLLILVVPPFLLLGIPRELVERMQANARVRRLERVLGHPAVAWPVGIGTLWIWHAPALYDAAVANENLHIFQHLTFLVSSTMFWWPVLAPLEERRLNLFASIFYLLGGSAANAVLGIIITFAPSGLYPAYLHPVDTLGIEHLLRRDWGLDPATDQQFGGLLMWVPGGVAYLCAIVGVFGRWFSAPDWYEEGEEPAVMQAPGGCP